MEFRRFILLLILLLSFIKNYSQNDCDTSIVVCGNTQFNGLTVDGVGTQELDISNACGGIENNSIWLKIVISASGTLGFILTPESNDLVEDFDFHVFGPNATCNNLGNSIRCSTTNPIQSGQTDNLTGMNTTETDLTEGPGNLGNSFVNWLTVTAGETYQLIIDRPIGSSNFNLEFTGTAILNTPPTIGTPILPTSPPLVLNQIKCDNDGILDLSTAFNINRNSDIIGTQTNVIVNYYTSENGAIIGGINNTDEILNISNFENTFNPQEIFVRITNTATGCFEKTNFKIEVYDQLQFPVTESSICDDATDGNNSNGRATFNLNNVLNDVFSNSIPTGIIFNFYLNQAIAQIPTSIPIPNLFYNTTLNQQTLVLKASTADGCEYYQDIILKVKPLPTKFTKIITQCDSDLVTDGFSLFSLNKFDNLFLNSDPNLTIKYFENASQLIANSPIINPFTNTINPQNIIVEITNSITNCSSLSTLILKVNTIQNYTIVPLQQCDDPILENGLKKFDLTNAIIPLTASQTLKYYLTANDALLELNEITSNINDYQNLVAYNDSVFVRIQDGNDCSTISELKLIVNKLPNIEKTRYEKDFICTNLPSKLVTINAGLLSGSPINYDYKWFLNGTAIAPTTYSININQEGSYMIEVKNKTNLCYKTATIFVKSSTEAIFNNILINDLVDENSVTILVSEIGNGKYEYGLDNPIGPFQESNYFENLNIGFHEVYVNDINGCGLVHKTISVLGAPKYFTPNDDGINDFWNIKGINTLEYKNAIIYIYDRFGRLLAQINPNSLGWNGKFNGENIIADDYWFTLQLEDGRNAKGHFSLKR